MEQGRRGKANLVNAEQLVRQEGAEGHRLTPTQRWLESEKLWQTCVALGGSLDPEPDAQSPFFDAGAPGSRSAHGRSGVRALRRGGGNGRFCFFTIAVLMLFGCQRTPIRAYPERTCPPQQATEPAPSIPPQIQTGPETGSPAEPSAVTYFEAISAWKSYKDLVRWMEKKFSLDLERFKRFEGTFPPVRSAEETFRRRSGIYADAVVLAKETLNRIRPSYKARIVVIVMRP